MSELAENEKYLQARARYLRRQVSLEGAGDPALWLELRELHIALAIGRAQLTASRLAPAPAVMASRQRAPRPA